MTFLELTNEVKSYLHVKGTEIEEMIKGFINESVLDFLRAGEWEKLKKNIELTLDDSNVYDLTDVLIITNGQFFSEMYLIRPNGKDATKLDFRQYLIPTDKAGYWSIQGTDLYITGTNTVVNFGYKNLGVNYPLSANDDEIPATLYYWDVIKKYAVVKVLDYLGDETMEKESGRLAEKLVFLKRAEKRAQKEGQLMNFSRNSG